MKVVVDGAIFEQQSRGGISRMFTEVLPRIAADDHLDLYLVTAPGTPDGLIRDSRIRKVAYLPLDRAIKPGRLFLWQLRYPFRALILRTQLGQHSAAIWHSTYYTRPVGWRGPRVVSVFDMLHERLLDLFSTRVDEQFRQFKRRSVLEAEAVICISNATKADLMQQYSLDGDRLHVVHLAQSEVFGRVASEEIPRASTQIKPFLLYVGGRQHYKNFTRLLTAYSEWKLRGEVDLVVVGSSWTRAETEDLDRLHIRECVHLLTNVEDVQLCHLYNTAVSFVYPSLYEGFGIPVLEALACGCPVVASSIPSTREIADRCPIYFDPLSTNDLLAALDRSASEGRGTVRVSEGVKLAGKYSWDLTAQRILDVYKTVDRV